MLFRQCKNRISKANNCVFGVPHVWLIASLESKMKQNGNKNTLHFPHEQNYGYFKEKSKETLNVFMVKREAFFNYTLSIAFFKSLGFFRNYFC